MSNEVKETKAVRQKIDYAKVKEVMLQNVRKTKTKTFTRYTKELVKQYTQNPYNNIDTLREISAFLARNSMIYKKILSYFSQMPLFYYNIVYKSDFTKGIDYQKFIKSYNDVSLKLQQINMQREFSKVIATALRDGVFYGYIYDGDGDGFFIHALEPKYCKISAITGDGEYVIYMDANYFNQGNNKEYVQGTDNGTDSVWDKVFIDGYNEYNSKGNDYRWFELPAEKTICLLADEDADMALPYFLPVFTSLLDLLDLEQILASKTELENYILLLSKIPLIPNTDEVDDFAVSFELVQMIQEMIDEAVPALVGTAYTPCDLEVVNFNNKNQAEDTNKLAEAMNNLFSNLGVSELVVSGGASTNSVGLMQSIRNDESLSLKYVDRLSAWMNTYIKLNYSQDFIFKFHRITYFSQNDFVSGMKDAATLGLPVAMDYATALGSTPYEVMASTYMENALEIKTKLWQPLQTSYVQSGTAGAPEKNAEDLSDEGLATRDGNKNDKTKAVKG